jgi:hypothetical protein
MQAVKNLLENFFDPAIYNYYANSKLILRPFLSPPSAYLLTLTYPLAAAGALNPVSATPLTPIIDLSRHLIPYPVNLICGLTGPFVRLVQQFQALANPETTHPLVYPVNDRIPNRPTQHPHPVCSSMKYDRYRLTGPFSLIYQTDDFGRDIDLGLHVLRNRLPAPGLMSKKLLYLL